MEIGKKNFNKILIIFLFSHLIIWTLIPTFSNENLPLDVIEAIAWGDGWPLGWQKHPPLSSWFPELFFQIFGNQDWSYYLLSQIFVITTFFVVYKFSEDFLKNRIYCLLSILLLEGIYFYNFTTPEFNVNICLMPFWALTVLYCWKGFKNNKTLDWLLLGLFAGFGILSKYLFIYLGIAIDIFLFYMIVKKKINFKCLISFVPFLIIFLPHLVWLIDNNYPPVQWALQRSGLEQYSFLDHILNPLKFLVKQAILLIPFFIMFYFLNSNLKIKINFKDNKLIFLMLIVLVPIILIFITSLISGARIRTMWMVPFYLFLGVLFIYLFQERIKLKKINTFFYVFLFLFIFSPAAYYLVSYTQTNKRTDYPGRKVAQIVQTKWNNNYSDKIKTVIGNEWHAGNLLYNLESRPKWKNKIDKNFNAGTVWIKGFNELKDCPGIFFQIESFNDICMIGTK